MDKLDVLSEVTGSIWKILVKAGDTVQEGEQLAVCESMKMEIPVEAEEGGCILEIRVNEGDLIKEGDVLMIIEVK